MKKLAKSLTEQAGREDAKKSAAAKVTIEFIHTDWKVREAQAREFANAALKERQDIHYTDAYVDAFRATLAQIWVTTLQAPEKARKGFREDARRHISLDEFYAKAERLARGIGFTGQISHGRFTFNDPTGKWYDFGSVQIRDESIWTDGGRRVDPDNKDRWFRPRDISIEVNFNGGSPRTVAQAVREHNRHAEIIRLAAELEVIAQEARVAYFEGDFSDILGHSRDIHWFTRTMSQSTAVAEAAPTTA